MSGGINLFQQHVVADKTPFDVTKLSDKLRRRQSDWTTPEAFLCVMLAASMADGNFDPEEAATIQAIARRSRALASVPANQWGRLNDIVNQRMAANPRAVEEAAATLPAEMCLSAFAHCMDIILSDGQLLKSEAEFLSQLATAMDIPQDHANRIMEVMLLKAQY